MKSSLKAFELDFEFARRGMIPRGSLWLSMLFIAVVLVAGCNGDPNVRKQKYLESGKRYSADAKYREAAIQFSNALKIDKTYPDAHYELAQAYEHLGEFSQAYSELARTVELQPANYQARIDLGKLLLAEGSTDRAQAQADAVMAAEPDNPDVHALLSGIAARQGHSDRALTEIQRALQLDPNRAAFHDDLAILQSGDPGNSARVEEELKKSIALDPKSVTPKLLLAAFYVKNSRWQEAEQACREAMTDEPKNLAARTTLAEVFFKQNATAKAEDVLRQTSQDLSDNPQGVRVLADYYASSGQMDKAKAEFSSLAIKYPKDVSIQKAYIRSLIEAKDYNTAQTVVTALMKKNPKDPEVAGLNGIVKLDSGRPSDAVNDLLNAVKDSPKDAFLQCWLGRAALAKGDVTLAEKSLRLAVNLNPGRLDAEEELARIAIQSGDINQLADVADKTIAAAPRFPGGYVWRAVVEMKQSAPEKAEADLRFAIKTAPQSREAYYQLGRLRFAQNRFPEGVSLLEQALQLDPDSSEALNLLVSYDMYQKQPDKALARVNAQIAKSPKNSSFYDLLASLQIQNRNLDQASASAQKAIQLNPADGEAVKLFAGTELQRGQTPNAIAAWEKWSNAHPSDAHSLAILGALEESRGEFRKAETYYRQALRIQPQQPLAANNLAYRMLVNGENVDVALTLAQVARRGMPESTDTADTLAWAYYHKGTYQFARDLLEEAVKSSPNDAGMEYHLGMVYSKLRDKNNATIHLKKAISLAANSPTGKDAKAALLGLG
jgi:Flp pilus assembly protein TadD